MSTSSKPSVLVVEDENVVAMDIVSSLEKLGYSLAGTAARGEDAVELAGDTRPGIVLMDINLRGDMDGVAAAEKIQGRLRIPVLYLTAYSDDATLNRARVTTPFGYLLKPFEDRELEVAIQTALYRHEMETALRDSERRLDAILESISDAVIATDADRRVNFLNRTAEALLGWRSDRAQGRAFEDILRVTPEGPDHQTLSRGNDKIPVEIRESPVTDSTGQPTGYVTVIRNVSERVRAQKAHERALMEQAARSAVEGERERTQLLGDVSTILADSFDRPAPERFQNVARRIVPLLGDWCVIDLWDDGVLRRTAVASADSSRAHLVGILHQNRSDWPGTVWTGPAQTAATAEPLFAPRVTEEFLSAGRCPASFEEVGLRSLIAVPLIARSTVVGALAVFWSDSERVYDEEDLRFVQQLADRCAVAFDNAQLYRQSQEAVRFRDDFLAIASHELRTPLSPLQVQIYLLEEQIRRLRPGEAETSSLESGLQLIRRQGDRLKRLVEELLDISRILGGRMHLDLEPVDLARIIRESVEESRSRKDLPQAVLRLDLPPSIVGRWDRLRLQQIVSNLIANALKYGRGQPVDIRASDDGDFAVLEIEDHGVGIAKEDQERIFGRFERAVSSRHHGGFGLGLFITSQSVEALGGSISLWSESGKGATFTVRLPRSGPPAETASSS